MTAYILGFALLLVVGGRLGDAFGRRRLLTAGPWNTTTALVTGAALGLGLEVVRLLAATGARVVIAARDHPATAILTANASSWRGPIPASRSGARGGRS